MKTQLVSLIKSAHECYGLSLRELAAICDIDHSCAALIVSGKRRPSRDILITRCAFGWQLSREETDEILLEADYPALGRSIRRNNLVA